MSYTIYLYHYLEIQHLVTSIFLQFSICCNGAVLVLITLHMHCKTFVYIWLAI